MSGPNDHADRESIGRMAQTLREHAAKNGQQITHAEATRRVERAVEQGDRKRENGNR